MRKGFSKKLSKSVRGFVGINRFGVPYGGLKHRSKKGHTQSVTISPLRKTFYQKAKIGKFDFKTKTNLETGSTTPKIEIRKRKTHY